ncbi:MAG TPA: iron-containing alcohol dehydrogenase [Candidatus Hydrogenedentes bacterium]|nr:iron-containing alcohol dehydrogenase [Candidatus Hydrogenedentota bacterium]HPG65834.1 iron-containing alcohol dehydrogenase [Candidatus Hydrogenedentota bacterium]
MIAFQWNMPTRVMLGKNALDSLANDDSGLGRRPLVVTGRSSARASGALDRLLAQWPNAVVFDKVEENPTTDTCDRGAAVCRENRCDLVVAIGGGSPMDAAKAIAMLACNPGRCEDYFGRDVFKKGNLPIIAVPTTAGTGSEVTPYAVITDHAHTFKKTIAGQTLFPQYALLDPTLSVSMSATITANTGFDALSHAVEGMISLKSTPLGDALALESCRVIRQWLPRAVEAPDDLEARGQMLYAAMLAGCVIAQSGTTAIHGMGYYFTLEFGLPHGLANALLLIPAFERNARCLPDKVAAIANALGHPAAPSADHAGRAFRQAIIDLAGQVGLDLSANNAGVAREALRPFAESIVADRPRFKNQTGDWSLEDVAAVFEDAWSGPTA